jgi:MFS family permease
MILFIGYVLFELPSNMVLKKVGPRIMLSGLGVCFGLITIACGLIKTWGALAALRVVLGIFEAVRSAFPTWQSSTDDRLGSAARLLLFVGFVVSEVRVTAKVLLRTKLEITSIDSPGYPISSKAHFSSLHSPMFSPTV